MWQVPVLPVALLLLSSLLVAAADPHGPAGPAPFKPAPRVIFSLLALLAIVAIAIPLASTTLVRQSQADAKSGHLAAALDAARSAQNAEPGAATPRLQQALLFETGGNLRLAALTARGATERESTNWRTWLVLSRIEAERGNADSAIQDFHRARSLNPHSTLFER